MLPHNTIRSQGLDVLPAMGNPEAALRPPTNDLSFYTAVQKTQSNMPQTSWKAILDQNAAVGRGILIQARGNDLTEKMPWDVENLPKERRTGD